jgi:hypothetical protein
MYTGSCALPLAASTLITQLSAWSAFGKASKIGAATQPDSRRLAEKPSGFD